MRDRSHPLELLRHAAARREWDTGSAGRAGLTESDFAVAARLLAAMRDY